MRKAGKIGLIAAIVMLVFAIGFVWYALSHPELSFPFSLKATYILYAAYLVVMVLLFLAGPVLLAAGRRRRR